jgi:hypothetical protein
MKNGKQNDGREGIIGWLKNKNKLNQSIIKQTINTLTKNKNQAFVFGLGSRSL